MKINISVTNQYGYDIAVYPYNNGALPTKEAGVVVSKLEGRGELTVDSGESGVIEVPGMGSLVVMFLGKQKLESYHEKSSEQQGDFDQCEQMVLIRYKTTELYWRFPTSDESPSLEISINDLGTVCCNKTSVGSIRQVSISELFIPPVFSADPFAEQSEEESQPN
jgi:hypothetical protein